MKKTDLPEKTLTQPPNIHHNSFIAHSASIMGDVQVAEQASIWYQAVLRGDINQIKIGKGSNVQDGAILHVENDRACSVGDYVTVGHRAILHGCTVKAYCLIGMGAIILNGATINEGALIGAGAVVTENTEVPPYTMWLGVPAKQLKVLPDTIIETHRQWAEKYIKLSQLHHEKGFSQHVSP